MNVRISYPKIQCLDANGNFAVGYELHTFLAGLSTPAVSYSNRTLTTPNSNPVVLNARGEADIYTGVALKLVYTIPGGDPASPIWSIDYIGEMQANFVVADGITATENNYTVTNVPAVSALTKGFMLIMMPDESNVDTIVSNVFTGTGIDDCTVTGPYIGSSSGSVFYIVIDNLSLEPPGAPTAVLSATAGIVTAGDHYVKVTFVNGVGETLPGTVSALVTADGTHKIDLTAIPVGTADVTSRKIYMTKAGGTTYYYIDEVPGNITTTYSINLADASLTVVAPTTNTTFDSCKWRKGAGAWTEEVEITASTTKQSMIEGVQFQFAVKTGHTVGDQWAVTVKTPARANMDGLGNLIIYKNEGGSITPLDGSDIVINYPAQLILNETLNGWLLINPATPTFDTPTISAIRYRKTLVSNYTLQLVDQGYEISFSGTCTLTLLPAPQFSNRFFYVGNTGTGIVTVDAGADYLIYGLGTRYLYIGPGGRFQLQTNGVDWHVMTSLGWPMLLDERDVTAVSSVLFTDLIPGTKYKITYDFLKNTGGHVILVFNADAGANYNGVYSTFNSVAAANNNLTNDIMTALTVDAATYLSASVEFETRVGNNKAVRAFGHSHYFIGAVSTSGRISGNYVGAADLTSATLSVSAGTVTGKVRLYKTE